MTTTRPRIIIVGAGFGGLYAARTLEKQPVDVLLIDRTNYHTFTPLMYQVATCGLEPSEIAYPVRGIFDQKSNVTFMMGDVNAIDYAERMVTVRVNGTTRQERYDQIIIAAGSVTNYFDKPALAEHAFELKTLSNAVEIRNHILRNFEKASLTEADDYRSSLTNMVVVGGGASGLETAGALYELYDRVLRREYRFLNDHPATVTLIEATDRLLPGYPQPLQESARRQLESLGVRVILKNGVEAITETGVHLKDGTFIASQTVIWLAGVKGSPIGNLFGLALNKANRVEVLPTMQVIDQPDVYAVGDLVYLEREPGKPYATVIPVAKQQGILAAHNILRRMRAEAQQSFKYIDRGSMATIGRSRAVAYLYNRIQLSGYVAWFAWLGLHLVALLGVRNRLNVFINWVWNYVTYDRSVRLILDRPLRTDDLDTAPLRETPVSR